MHTLHFSELKNAKREFEVKIIKGNTIRVEAYIPNNGPWTRIEEDKLLIPTMFNLANFEFRKANDFPQ